MYPQQIIDALQHVRYPGTGKNLIESGMLEDDIRISGLEVSFSLIFEKDNDPFRKSVVKAAETAKEKAYQVKTAALNDLNTAKETETASTIKKVYESDGYILDTHTAVAATVYDKYLADTKQAQNP